MRPDEPRDPSQAEYNSSRENLSRGQEHALPGNSPPPQLTPAHLAMLTEGSGIAPDVVAERGYRSCTGYRELKSLGIVAGRHTEAHGVLLPLWGLDGTPATHLLVKEHQHVPYMIFRPDIPVIGHDGRERKYLNPTSVRIRLDAHPRCQTALQDPTRMLWVTEGIKKGDALVSHGACAIALLGVQCWRLPDWHDVRLKGRSVGIVFDSDVMTKAEVHKALTALTDYLTYKGAAVRHVYLPSTPGAKTGVDDYLLSKTLADLEALLEPPRGRTKVAAIPAGDWRAQLLLTNGGRPQETYGNLRLCAAHGKERDTLWYDAVADRPMVGDVPLTDALVEQAAEAIEREIRIPIRTLKLVRTALVAQCRAQTRDPIHDWLKGLPPWDGIPRLTTWLVHYAGADDSAYSQETSRLWVVSMVARALVPGCQCRSVLVLIGDENIGKSKLVKLMASERWYRDVSGSLEGKEAHMLLKGTWLVELGELATMGTTEENRLKSFITMTNDAFIPKYANDPVSLARRTILVGTMNPDGDQAFLRGQTGNTRYYPLQVKAVDLDTIAKLRDQLFAEALVYYTQHQHDWWVMTPAAEGQATAIREDYRIKSVYEEPLGAWLEGRAVTCWQEICEQFLLLEAKERWKDTKLQRDIAVALRANGWRQEKQRRLAGYGVVRPWTKGEDTESVTYVTHLSHREKKDV